MTDIDDFFVTGPPSVKFANVGDVNTGYIVKMEKAQAIDFDTQKPAFWDEAKTEKKMNLIFWLAETPGGEAFGRLYALKPSAMLAAIGDAVRTAGKNVPELGGKLDVKRKEDNEIKRGTKTLLQKQFKVKYEAPAPKPAFDEDDF